jgi:nitrogen-specific signal transduction histidine kinase
MATSRVSMLRSVPDGAETSLVAVRELLNESTNSPVWDSGGGNTSYRAVLEVLLRFTRVQAVCLLIHDGRREELLPAAVAGIGDGDASTVKLNDAGGLPAAVMDNLQTLLLNKPSEDQSVNRRWNDWWSAKLRPNSVRNAAFVPVCGDFEFRCILQFFNRLNEENALAADGFSDEDGVLLETLSNLVTMSLNKIWLMNRIEILNEAVSGLHGQSDVRELSNKIARAGTRLANAAACAVFLPDPIKPESLKLQGSWGFRQNVDDFVVPRDKSLAGRVMSRNRIEEVLDLQNSTDSYPHGPGRREGMASVLALPLGSSFSSRQEGEKAVVPASGALHVYTSRKRHFSQSTCNLLQQFSLSTGAVLQNKAHAEETEGLRQILILAAHSLRSPLDRIGQALHKIRRQDKPSRHSVEVQAAFTNLELANSRITTMLHSRSGIIEMTGLEVTRVELGKIIADCKARHAPMAGEVGITIRVNESVEELPPIRGDRSKLDLVFDNLLENAIKYSWRPQQEVVISSESDSHNVKISILDKGLGIPENAKKKIFESFVRSEVLDRARHISGTGLGLFVSKMIVEAHGGAISVKSTPFLNDPERRLAYDGFDTIFTVSLPIDGVY